MNRLRRFFRSPKGYLTAALLGLTCIAAPGAGPGSAFLEPLAAVLAATVIDASIVRLRSGVWRFPTSAILTGLIAGLVLSPIQPLYVPIVAGAIGVASKHVLRLGRSHIFNPAAIGLLAVYAIFGTGQSWWGALPEAAPIWLLVLLVAGYLVAQRANKLPAALAFLGSFVTLCTTAAILGQSAAVAELFRPPFINAALFFGFFMVTDPPTSPVQFHEQAWFGVLVGSAGFVIYVLSGGALYYLLAAALAGNTAYALWRQRSRLPALTRPFSSATHEAPSNAR